jgi:hypothetical protein
MSKRDRAWYRDLTRLEQAIKANARRIALLEDIRSGNVRMRKVVVTRKKMKWTVKAKSRTYVRYVAPKNWKESRHDVGSSRMR